MTPSETGINSTSLPSTLESGDLMGCPHFCVLVSNRKLMSCAMSYSRVLLETVKATGLASESNQLAIKKSAVAELAETFSFITLTKTSQSDSQIKMVMVILAEFLSEC